MHCLVDLDKNDVQTRITKQYLVHAFSPIDLSEEIVCASSPINPNPIPKATNKHVRPKQNQNGPQKNCSAENLPNKGESKPSNSSVPKAMNKNGPQLFENR